MSIEIQSLSHRYGRRASLADVSLSVRPGEIVGLLGGNGAGKSTLFRILCGLLVPAAGSVRVAGHPLPGEGIQARAAVGYVAQRFGLYEDLTVEENLEFYARAYGLDGPELRQRVAAGLDRFGLAGRRRDVSGTLSHGWKQRLAMGCAVAHRPAVLLLDEATAGLDPSARAGAWNILQQEAARGAAVLLSTHHLDEAERCHSQIWLDEGRVVPGGVA
jgi:ABC-2 type transport system ATP-binding protein